MSDVIENKVAKAGLLQLDLLTYKPEIIHEIDLKEQLWQGLAIKEKDFRTWIKENDWSQYTEKNVCLYCSVDAILPPWVFMLVTSALSGHTQKIYTGTKDKALQHFWMDNVQSIKKELIEDQRVVIKGCGDETIPVEIFAAATQFIQQYAKKIMYGEPCSTVPIFKKA